MTVYSSIDQLTPGIYQVIPNGCTKPSTVLKVTILFNSAEVGPDYRLHFAYFDLMQNSYATEQDFMDISCYEEQFPSQYIKVLS